MAKQPSHHAPADTTNAQKLYGETWAHPDSAFDARLQTSLGPRGPELLDERFATFGIQPDHLVLDVGARDARYAIDIATAFGCRVIATDPVAVHLDLARQKLAQVDIGIANRIKLSNAAIESMPFAEATFDHIWCRDMLNHVGLRRGLAELERVLKPGGRVLVYQTFATPTLDSNDARRLYETMSIVAENMDPDFFRSCLATTTLTITNEIEVGSEWREAQLERDKHRGTADLLRVSRMRRDEDTLVAQFGRARFETTLAETTWSIYLGLGKLTSWIFEIQRPAS